MKRLVVIPTYNERANIGGLIHLIAALPENFDILVVDDNSADGTGILVDGLLSSYNGRLKVAHRQTKSGHGTAYVHGFGFGLEHGYEQLFQIDADFSHSPRYLSILSAELKDSDVIIGSRYLNGASRRKNWSFKRLLLSRAGGMYLKTLLDMGNIADPTSGLVGLRKEVLERIGLRNLRSTGFAIHFELVWWALRNGFKVKEVPIEFVGRKHGRSKLSLQVAMDSLNTSFRLFKKERCG